MRVACTADWVYCGHGPPLPQGVVLVEDGQIIAVQSDVPTGIPVRRFTNAALLPGLVNAHTHLEFSGLTSPLEPRDRFADWIRSVVDCRRERGAEQDWIPQGLHECESTGTVAFGEIATSDWLAEASVSVLQGLTGVVFREVLGLRPESHAAQLETAQRHLSNADRDDAIIRGLSPHAPYSVHPALLRSVLELARQFQAPVAMHLAESQAELELLDRGSGPLVELLTSFSVWNASDIPLGTRPLDYLRLLAPLPCVLVVHGNHLDDEELRFLAEHPHMSVVYCPRTHAAMGHPPHRWREMLEMGINVCLGTDSRASNPDLSVWDELRLVQSLAPDMPASSILRLGTVNGVRALGLSHAGGTIAPGQPANFLVASGSEQLATDPELVLLRNADIRV
ncbi:MAG: amidohydrolase family protein, partial [Planctomycetaceae bacterium]|nr:amidohydrolase family protein [Planctomycetaceae bacterium]